MTTNAFTRWMTAALAAVAALALAPSVGDAYHPIPGFHQEAQFGGAARQYYTGSPRWEGQDCGSCHVDTPGLVRFQLTSTPEDLFATGRYEPGQVYRIRIDVAGAEGKGLRTWMMETLDDGDRDVGDYSDVPNGCTTPQGTTRGCLQPSCNFMCRNQIQFKDTCAPAGVSICNELIQIPGCGHCGGGDSCSGCVTVDGIVGGVTVPPPWQLDFIAPAAGTGPINIYFGGVAGTSDHSSLDDDYEMQAHRLCEGMTDCATDPLTEGEEAGDYVPDPAGGCSTGGTGGAGWIAFGLLIAVAIRGGGKRSRREKRAR